ncbi:hypothetical protein [Reinekea marinisedimentorum]|uniref:Uncharacterized protein n=1 Tax=Reinekea marinisedimentorum TaxID=230495 RepID=A0A4R3I0J2_9GAMM|nr:hypothetical protein [Reinekea marinisedimentorum]TCS39048.1 hypothetical protein BCF53_11395 [Reinekea marinisedimentorum]
MIESYVTFIFRVPAKDLEKWKSIVNDLKDGHFGARLEDHFEYFGEEAEGLLCDVMDTWEEYPNQKGCISAENSFVKGDEIHVELIGASALSESTPLLKKLFVTCGVSFISDSLIDEGYMSED